MRTLILDMPLPHVTLDNFPVLSAPSVFDHGRVVVEMSALSDAVEEFGVRLAHQGNEPEQPPQCIRKEAS
jgi:hypothetical protein